MCNGRRPLATSEPVADPFTQSWRNCSMNKFDLDGRKALVTGGARGLGAGMAAALSKAGAAVMIGDVLKEVGRETVKTIAAGGAKAGFVALDVTDDASWQAAVSATI